MWSACELSSLRAGDSVSHRALWEGCAPRWFHLSAVCQLTMVITPETDDNCGAGVRQELPQDGASRLTDRRASSLPVTESHLSSILSPSFLYSLFLCVLFLFHHSTGVVLPKCDDLRAEIKRILYIFSCKINL